MGCQASNSLTIHVKLDTKFAHGFRVMGGVMLAYAEEDVNGRYTLRELQTAIMYLLRHVSREE